MSKEQDKRAGGRAPSNGWGDMTDNLADNDGFPTANEHKWDGEEGSFHDNVLGSVDICTQRHLPNSDPANEGSNEGKDNYTYQDSPWDHNERGKFGDYVHDQDKQEKDRE